MEFQADEEEFELAAAGAKVRVVPDNFGRINSLYVTGSRDHLEPLQAALRAHRGDRQ